MTCGWRIRNSKRKSPRNPRLANGDVVDTVRIVRVLAILFIYLIPPSAKENPWAENILPEGVPSLHVPVAGGLAAPAAGFTALPEVLV